MRLFLLKNPPISESIATAQVARLTGRDGKQKTLFYSDEYLSDNCLFETDKKVSQVLWLLGLQWDRLPERFKGWGRARGSSRRSLQTRTEDVFWHRFVAKMNRFQHQRSEDHNKSLDLSLVASDNLSRQVRNTGLTFLLPFFFLQDNTVLCITFKKWF